MANEKHLEIIKQGTKVWNEWRIRHPGIQSDLSDADLRGINFSRANLSRAHLSGTNLSRANLGDTNFANAIVRWTIFGDIDLRKVKGLESIKHDAPSTIGMDALIRSEGDIPVSFLKGAGVSDSLIEYARSLIGRAIEYYTCFISYSSLDQNFAERLYADLQNKGVRCWFAPHNMKIGDKIRPRIDESIRIYDKLLLVLSEHSVNSAWVEKEVETAFEKENRNKSLVLFPIKLDETVMHTNQAWAADIRRMRHIGNMSQWKDHDAYQRGLQRLLRDLKQEKG
ncbi:toll/interleukin-1 receptor domain-containing protein [Reticulibacter mediterranei]|uniref:toll/interleukin-1 receptor domain-containing protein n=1 Tax=Reticulibacter mediterranei TaxID=2778369 RepID=UPI001C68C4B0|nr:TIR domain-containing protein [Reticulibacter mediterranei]